MNIDRLRALVEHALNAGTSLTQYDEGGVRLTIRSITDGPPPPHEALGGSGGSAGPDTTVSLAAPPDTVNSALFGLFHLQPGGGAPPFVSLGQTVEAGQKIGLIEAMKVFSPVLSHRAGRIVAVLAEHGAEVECGQPLFHVE